MITDEQVRSIALFFFLSLMDEKAAIQASERAVTQLKSKKESSVDDPTLIRLLSQYYKQFSKQVVRQPLKSEPDIAWAVSPPVDLGTWVKFHQEVGKSELIAVLLSRVLGFKDEAIASGLGVSLGTARHRIGKGMRQLGAHLKQVRA